MPENQTDIVTYLKLMVEQNASDLFFSSGAPVNMKREGVTTPITRKPLTDMEVSQLAYSLMNDEQSKSFETDLEMNLAISVSNIGRFRVNIYRQRGAVGMVIRYIKSSIPTIDELHLPEILKELITEPRGLILVVGATGSGKSTTLASMIDHRNQRMTGHILTIEDPIEFLHHHKQSIVDQREVGLDTLSYASALKNALREAPDVILIGEIRDRDTMQQAITYAETGHLCLSTLHANNAYQSLERVINFFPDTAHTQLFDDLALNLRAIISQRLLVGQDGRRIAAVEIMLNTPYIAELIRKGDIEKIHDAMEQGKERGMTTFDDAVYDLYRAGKISLEQAMLGADSRNNLQVRIRLTDSSDRIDIGDGLSIMDDDFKGP